MVRTSLGGQYTKYATKQKTETQMKCSVREKTTTTMTRRHKMRRKGEPEEEGGLGRQNYRRSRE